MAINVQLIDALVQVGGNFQDALAFVKSFQHLPFDRERKLWTLPITDLKTFQARCTFPFDIASASQSHRSGEHVTRYGTRYSRDAWEAKRASDALVPPDALVDAAQANKAAAEAAFLASLRVFGYSDALIARLRSIYDRFVGDLDEAEELGYVTFPVPGRKQQIEAIFETYYDAMLKADECVQDWLAAKQYKIDDSYGML